MENIVPQIHDSIVDFINKKLRMYSVENKPKKVVKNEDRMDVNKILFCMMFCKFLRLETKEYPKLVQPTQEDYDANYQETWDINEFMGRDDLQDAIVRHFKKVKVLVEDLDLYDCSSFSLAFDQSDYEVRQKLTRGICKAEQYDSHKILNSDVYKKKFA